MNPDHYDPDSGDLLSRSEELGEQTRIAAIALEQEVPAEARRRAEQVSWRIAIAGAVLAIIISVGGGLVTYQIASAAAASVADETVARKAAQEEQRSEQATTNQAIEQLRASNETLLARGQAPVVSPGPDPSTSEALVAAATARVLAALPQTPTTAQIGRMIALAAAAQPAPGPTAVQVSTAVASYLAANPPPAGAKGDRGDQGPEGKPGPPPTAAAIDAAVAAYLQANPPAPGQPPLSWTYVDVMGSSHTCTRTDPFDPAAPMYSCD